MFCLDKRTPRKTRKSLKVEPNVMQTKVDAEESKASNTNAKREKSVGNRLILKLDNSKKSDDR